MASGKPIVRQVAWLSLIPQMLVLFGIIFLFRQLGIVEPIVTGAAAYLIILLVLRKRVALDHRKGINLFKKSAYAEAIPHFEKSYAFFNKHSWIDRWRYIVLLSSSKISYREMALLNIAFCHGQTGNGPESKKVYEQTLQEFPDSEMAKAALNMIESVQTGNNNKVTG